MAGKEEELPSLVERPDKTSAALGMEISAKKTRLMIKNTYGISTDHDIRINCEKLDEVYTFKYLGAVITDSKVPRLRYCPGLHRKQQHQRD